MKLLVSLALALVAAKSVSGQCDYDFCAGGITVPGAIVNPEDDPIQQATCAQVPFGISVGALTAEQCDGLPALETICCPPTGPLPCGNSTIEFCAGGIEFPNEVVNPQDPVEDQAPCSYIIAGILSGVFAPEECDGLLLAEYVCCPGSIEPIGENTTAPPVVETLPPSDEEESCHICGSDASYNADKEFGGQKCSDINKELEVLPPGDFCDSIIAGIIDENGFDVQSFCECEGKAAPDLCTVCADDEELDLSKEVPGEDFTCGVGADFVSHLNDAAACGEYITSDIKSFCCKKKQGGGGDKESGAMSLTIGGLASALLLVLTFGI